VTGEPGVQVNVPPSSRSSTVTFSFSCTPPGPVASFVWGPGRPLMTGGEGSTIVTRNEACDVLPSAADAGQVTVVMPTAKPDPDCGTQLELTTLTASVKLTA